jgi:hypothetical protein
VFVPAATLRDEEIRLIGRVLEAGLPCLRLPDMVPRFEMRADQVTKDVYESFAEIFSVFTVRRPTPAALRA